MGERFFGPLSLIFQMVNPTIQDFKNFFTRDFPYGNTETEVMDSDISRALIEAGEFVNQSLFPNQAKYTLGFLYLTAHFLVTNLRESSQGVSSKYSWLQSSRGVGSVSESLAIPDDIASDPTLSVLSSTGYGVKYILMIMPFMRGNVFTVGGRTRP